MAAPADQNSLFSNPGQVIGRLSDQAAKFFSENTLLIVGIAAVIILLIIVYFFVLRKRKNREPVPRVPHPPRARGTAEPTENISSFGTRIGSDATVRQVVDAMATGQPVAGQTQPAVSPVSNQNKQAPIENPLPQVPKKQEKMPRRMKRFERRENAAGENAFRGYSSAVPARHGRSEEQIPDLDVLAENIAEDAQRSEAVDREMQELQKRLGKMPNPNSSAATAVSSAGTNAQVGSGETPSQRHHSRRMQKQAETQKEESSSPAVPTASMDALSKVQNMDFKDLFENKEGKNKKKKNELDDVESDLQELGGDADDKDGDGEPETCPSCRKETEKVLYCPECGNAFCKNCAAAFKRKGNDSYLVCPKCQTEVKSG
ncbi:MAG: hypothetical protein V1777_04580 [Candidatus Micrarchaeota archaeon]